MFKQWNTSSNKKEQTTDAQQMRFKDMTLSEISQTLFDSTYMQFKNRQSNHGDVN